MFFEFWPYINKSSSEKSKIAINGVYIMLEADYTSVQWL